MTSRNHCGEPGLDYRDARKRFAPHVAACTRCDTLVTTPLERAEQIRPRPASLLGASKAPGDPRVDFLQASCPPHSGFFLLLDFLGTHGSASFSV